jgi:glycerol-3-phosphate dehydrogenase
MRRDFDALGGRRFDLLVVGGGIHGLFAAYEAASRGLSVALVEAGDFGGGVTFNHQRTLHGGLRALQSGNLLKARRQIAERRTWAVIAPHLVRPLPFLVGTYRFTSRSRTVFRLGFAVYDTLGRRRNAGVAPELHLPRARLESRATTRALFPGIRDQGLSGGAVWYDYQTRHPERLTWCVALAAAGSGATLVNHAEAIAPRRANGRFAGCTVRDRLDGQEIEVDAAITLLAAGSRLSQVHQRAGLGGAPPLLRAINVLVNRPARDIALAAASSSGRTLTAVPWAGHVLVGTYQSSQPVDPSETGPPAEAVHELLSEANSAFPALGAGPADVRLVHHGLTPAVVRGGRTELMPEHQIVRHGSKGAPGVISLVGVKYTTARLAARQAIDAVVSEAGGGAARRSRTAISPLPFAGIADAEGRLIESMRERDVSLDPEVAAHLTSWYGIEAADVVEHAAATGGLERLVAGSPALAGEVTYAAEHAAAAHLDDVVLRRTALAAAGHPGADAVRRAASLLAARAGWSVERTAAEIERVDTAFVHATVRP